MTHGHYRMLVRESNCQKSISQLIFISGNQTHMAMFLSVEIKCKNIQTQSTT